MRRVLSTISVVVLAAVFVMTGGGRTCGKAVDTDKIVREMLAARHARAQIPYPTKTYGSFDIERAYQIQADLARELSKELGPVVGYKVAYASKAAQEQFGVTEPARGPLFSLQRVPSGSRLPAGHFMEIALETEVAFTIGKLGGTLEPGAVISTGTAAPAYKVKAGAIKGSYVGDCGPLGQVTLTLY